MDAESKRVLLLTNDDGLDEPGLAALLQAVGGLGEPVVIAPTSGQSGGSHAVTLKGHLAVRRHEAGRFGVGGSPADCVRLGLHHLARETAWVLSGINAGGNLGTDLFHSGTAAAAREAASRGVPGIAISRYIARGREIDWDQAARWTARVLKILLARPWVPGTFWNVNLPHREPGTGEPRVRLCRVDPSPLPLSFELWSDNARYAGNYQERERLEAGDVAVCFGGDITVSRVRLDMDHGDPAQDLDEGA